MKKLTFIKRKSFTGIVFILPWAVGAIFLFIFPVINSFMQSVNNRDVADIFTFEFVGLGNFKKAFLEDVWFIPNFLSSVTDTLFRLPMIIVFSIFIAVLINRKMMLQGFFREVFFFPVLLGTGFVMQQLLKQNIDSNALDIAKKILMPEYIMIYLGPKLSQTIIDFFSNITVILWSSGVQILLFLSGLQSIPTSLYESAYVDGATEWEKFWKITLPMLSPTILLTIIYTLVDSFTNASNPLLNYIMLTMLTYSDFPYASAMGAIYFAFILVLVGVIFLIMRPFIHRVNNR
ncbi:MAG: carbohydrate ABC transporter permease [Saccharofermentanales bacterium]